MTRETGIRRILVAVDVSPASLAALDLAAELAAALGAELAGVFVEDPRWLRVARLPIARAIGAYSAVARPLDPEHVALQLRAQAGRARDAVAATAVKAGVRWSFRTLRGPVASSVAAVAAVTDLVSVGRVGWERTSRRGLGRTARAVVESARSMALVFGRIPVGLPVSVVYDGSPAGERALLLGAALSGRLGDSLIVLVAADSRPEAEERRRAAAVLLDPRAPARFVDLAGAGPAAILTALGPGRQGVLVLPAELPWLQGEPLLDLLAKLEQPVLRVG